MELTASQLQELIATAVTAAVSEAKKPYISDEQKRNIADAQQARKEQAGLHRQMVEEKIRQQKLCTHEHARGDTHGVYVQNGNYILCQKCQSVIRPETDPQTFSKIFQKLHNSEFFGG